MYGEIERIEKIMLFDGCVIKSLENMYDLVFLRNKFF